MNTSKSRFLCLAAFASLALPFPASAVSTVDTSAPAAEPAAEARTESTTQFMKLSQNREGQPESLETASVRYVKGNGEDRVEVDLIGVVHVGEPGYYQSLNEKFESYDVLLYELVAPEGTRIPRGGQKSTNPLAILQRMATHFLNLQHQMEGIDYTKENFVHADLSPEEMAEAIRKRGDNALTLALSVTADLLRQANLEEMSNGGNSLTTGFQEIDPFALFLDPYGAAKMKRAMAVQFADLTSPGSGLGKTMETILIDDRNKAAMKVVEREIDNGHEKIGLFYGAAHMNDFEERLLDLGFERTDVTWLTAWDLTLKPTPTGFDKLFELFEVR